ncbi:MAG: hypothetical protein AAF743_11690, partial [Planctomycetota bacterium]
PQGEVTVVTAQGPITYLLTDFLKPGRLTDALGNVSRVAYDDNGNPTRQFGPGGIAYRFQYNDAGQLVGLRDPLGGNVSVDFINGFDLPGRINNARGFSTNLGFDGSGNLQTIADPDGTTRTFTYDTKGRVETFTNARGQTITNTYNAAGQVLTRTLPGGFVETFDYDALGRLRSFTDATGTTTFTYDAAGEIERVDYPGGQFLAFDYDNAGRRTSITDELGQSTRFEYDAQGRIARVEDGGGDLVAAYT